MTITTKNRFQVLAEVNETGESVGNQQNVGKQTTLADPILTKKYFKLLQAIHHSEILAATSPSRPYPAGMLKQVTKLTTFIKPSSPDQIILEQVKKNTLDWMSRNMTILKEHYDRVLATLLSEVGEFEIEAFNRAIVWAKLRYRKRFTNTSVETLKNILVSETGTDRGLTRCSLDQAPSPFVGPTTRSVGKTYAIAVRGDQETVELITQDATIRSDTNLCDRQTAETSRGLSLEGEQKIALDIEPLIPKPQRNRLSLRSRTHSNVACVKVDEITPSPLPAETNLGAATGGTPLPSPNPVQGSDDERMLGDTTETELLLNGPRTEPPLLVTNMRADGRWESESLAGRREPKRHPRSSRKISDWSIEIVKNTLIVGDSNLARIPSFVDETVQVDSFPGATFYHIRGVLEKAEPRPSMQKVILSVGLNNCLGKQTSFTTLKQLQRLLKICEIKFPNAEIYVPVINYSERLERETQMLIEKLNQAIIEKCNFLPELTRLRFHTEPHDPVHWRADTAQEILTFWLDQVNM